jgi:hypothetical protein
MPSITPTPGRVIQVTPGPTALPSPTPPALHSKKACARINFEVSGDSALAGTYQLVETDGRLLATWQAQNGWEDSGWITVKIAHPSVYVQVFYLANPSAIPVELQIINPAPGTNYGWLTEDMCHAIEVGWQN